MSLQEFISQDVIVSLNNKDNCEDFIKILSSLAHDEISQLKVMDWLMTYGFKNVFDHMVANFAMVEVAKCFTSYSLEPLTEFIKTNYSYVKKNHRCYKTLVGYLRRNDDLSECILTIMITGYNNSIEMGRVFWRSLFDLKLDVITEKHLKTICSKVLASRLLTKNRLSLLYSILQHTNYSEDVVMTIYDNLIIRINSLISMNLIDNEGIYSSIKTASYCNILDIIKTVNADAYERIKSTTICYCTFVLDSASTLDDIHIKKITNLRKLLQQH